MVQNVGSGRRVLCGRGTYCRSLLFVAIVLFAPPVAVNAQSATVEFIFDMAAALAATARSPISRPLHRPGPDANDTVMKPVGSVGSSAMLTLGRRAPPRENRPMGKLIEYILLSLGISAKEEAQETKWERYRRERGLDATGKPINSPANDGADSRAAPPDGHTTAPASGPGPLRPDADAH